MPWTCPACRHQVQHSESLPRPDQVYRCPVCRLNMTFDPSIKKMRPVPPDNHDNGEKPRKIA